MENMEEIPKKEKRKRIEITEKMLGAKVVVDELAFVKNKCSDVARHIEDIPNLIKISLWHDKHYVDRVLHGDESGPRDGIDYETIKKVVSQSLNHLLFYSSKLDNFKFLNDIQPGFKPIRFLLQQPSLETTLNIVVEIHFINFNKYEVTVVTAMSTDTFKVSDGQYILEMPEKDFSILKRYTRGNITTISECQT